MRWNAWAASQLEQVRASNRWREVRPCGQSSLISFAGNDYLGLTRHPEVRRAAIEAVERFGTGAAASRLVTGTLSIHHDLERAIANWQGTQHALVLPSGYHANLAVMAVFGAEDVTIFSDELNHASIIDGCRLSKARVVVYRHRDVDHLSDLMRIHTGRRLLVSDLVFSMDGDEAPVAELAAVCRQHDAMLVLDEAHAVMRTPATPNCETLYVGTLSKTLAAQGGWIAGSQALIELLINRARPFIFTTALSPATAASALAALRVLLSPEGVALRVRLRGLIESLRPAHPSPIIPYMLGDEAAALKAAALLREHGLLVPAIRPPSVPIGTSRLRVALSAAHRDDELQRLRAVLAQCIR
jgi:8-amino-7-oxononanoate synthase